MDQEFEGLLEQLGMPPRKFNWIDRKFINKCSKPAWDWEKSDVAVIINSWNDILINGKLGWAHLIQANSLMFSPGKYDSPGELVVCKNKCFPEELERIAEELYSLKGQSGSLSDPEEKDYALHLEDEISGRFGLPVPKSISERDDLFISSCFFQRKRLPKRYLENSFFPVLYLEESPFTVMIVPDFYWSRTFRKWWES